MPPRKKPISQLADSTKKKNPSRVRKRMEQPITSGELTVPAHFSKQQKISWAEIIQSYPGLNLTHRHLIEIAANALLRSRLPNAKSSELSFFHRLANQLQQATIDYVPSVAPSNDESADEEGSEWDYFDQYDKRQRLIAEEMERRKNLPIPEGHKENWRWYSTVRDDLAKEFDWQPL